MCVCVLGGVICFTGIPFNDYYNYNVYMKKESKQERERSIVCICEGGWGRGGVNRWRGLGRGWLEPQLKTTVAFM